MDIDSTKPAPMLYVAIPAMDELDWLPDTLHAIENQECSCNFKIFICINQPDCWWNDAEKSKICKRNQELLSFLQNYKSHAIYIIDRTSLGKGWQGKNFGVGWARRTLFEEILQEADNEDIILSLDADTLFNAHYFTSIIDNFSQNKNIAAISVPYYHRLTDDESLNRALLRYEIYMRLWILQMYRIESPYNFTALGSAIALKVSALRKIRNIAPLKSGEDFYLLQKLRKMSPISNWNSEWVYPATRLSSRVFFGTGVAMTKGIAGNWSSYPFYHYSLFDEIAEAYQLVKTLFLRNIEHPFFSFIQENSGTKDIWILLRANFKDPDKFLRAFHTRADGLRILQYLKMRQAQLKIDDWQCLQDNLNVFFPNNEFFSNMQHHEQNPEPSTWLTLEQLINIRDKLFEKEMESRRCKPYNISNK